MYFGKLNNTLDDNAGGTILDNGITRIQFDKVLENPERSQGVDGDGASIFHGHIAADLVPHTLVLDDVRLPCPCRAQNKGLGVWHRQAAKFSDLLNGTPVQTIDSRSKSARQKRCYRMRVGTV